MCLSDGHDVFFSKGLSALVSGGIFPPVLFQSRFIIFFFFVHKFKQIRKRRGEAVVNGRSDGVGRNQSQKINQFIRPEEGNDGQKLEYKEVGKEETTRVNEQIEGATLLPDCQDCQCLCFLFEEGLIWCCAATKSTERERPVERVAAR